MNYEGTDIIRIAAEYRRRAREVPADYYAWSRPANLLMHTQTLRAAIDMLCRASLFPLRGRRIVDIGCGNGTWLLEYMQWGANSADLAGIDLMPERIAQARLRLPAVDLRVGSASELPWPDESFDIVSQFLVFMNMSDPALKRAVAGEMLRVLRPGGAILWFDLRVSNPRNPNARGLRSAEIRALFPGCPVTLAPALLAPPLARLIAGWSWPLAEALRAARLLCTHYAGLIRKL
jgi:ubiquinone/menaquinone biosynthesis C-methylase UbiE